MRNSCLLVCVVFLAMTASAQDWQSYRSEGHSSFNDVKAAVRRVNDFRGYTGWDEKIFSRSGDLVAVAILKTLDDTEMASPDGAKSVLLIVRMAFACRQKCIEMGDDRRPKVTLLLLDHLNEITGRKMQTEIQDMKEFIQTGN